MLMVVPVSGLLAVRGCYSVHSVGRLVVSRRLGAPPLFDVTKECGLRGTGYLSTGWPGLLFGFCFETMILDMGLDGGSCGRPALWIGSVTYLT